VAKYMMKCETPLWRVKQVTKLTHQQLPIFEKVISKFKKDEEEAQKFD
jgi:hypothetical protein